VKQPARFPQLLIYGWIESERASVSEVALVSIGAGANGEVGAAPVAGDLPSMADEIGETIETAFEGLTNASPLPAHGSLLECKLCPAKGVCRTSQWRERT
jgi:hypothetical protein